MVASLYSQYIFLIYSCSYLSEYVTKPQRISPTLVQCCSSQIGNDLPGDPYPYIPELPINWHWSL